MMCVDVKDKIKLCGTVLFYFLYRYIHTECMKKENNMKQEEYVVKTYNLNKIIYVFLTIFLYLLKCPQSLIL